MNLKSFKHTDWVKIYDGKWSFLTTSHFGDMYTKYIRFGPRPFMPQIIVIVSNHRSAGWVRQSDRDKLGGYLSKKIMRNPKLANTIANDLKTQAKSILK